MKWVRRSQYYKLDKSLPDHVEEHGAEMHHINVYTMKNVRTVNAQNKCKFKALNTMEKSDLVQNFQLRYNQKLTKILKVDQTFLSKWSKVDQNVAFLKTPLCTTFVSFLWPSTRLLVS